MRPGFETKTIDLPENPRYDGAYKMARGCYGIMELEKKTGIDRHILSKWNSVRKFSFKVRRCSVCNDPMSRQSTADICTWCRYLNALKNPNSPKQDALHS